MSDPSEPDSTPPFGQRPGMPGAAPGSRRPIPRRGSANLVIVVGCVLTSLLTSLGSNTARLEPLMISHFPAIWPDTLLEVRHGEIWRLITPIFIHFGFAHIGLNMLAAMNLGDPLERVEGTGFYLIFCGVIAVCSNLGQYLISGSPNFGGFSGVIFGMFGYIWLRGRCDPFYLLRLNRSAVYTTLVWFFFCFTGIFPIANYAHAVGLVIGVAWGTIGGLTAARRERARAAAQDPVVSTQVL